jgi:two-component system response regulator RegA
MDSAKQPSLLIIEDDEKLRRTLELEFKDRGYIIHSLPSLRGLDSLAIEELKFAVIDLRLGGEDGLVGLGHIKTNFPECRVVMITGYGTIATAVAAMKKGAASYLTKPFDIATLEQHLWYDQVSLDQDSSVLARASLDQHEREYIEYVLAQCDGNISKAARWLNIHRQSLQRKLRKYPQKVGGN